MLSVPKPAEEDKTDLKKQTPKNQNNNDRTWQTELFLKCILPEVPKSNNDSCYCHREENEYVDIKK